MISQGSHLCRDTNTVAARGENPAAPARGISRTSGGVHKSNRSAMHSKPESAEFLGLVIGALWATQPDMFRCKYRNRQSELDLPSFICR